MSKYSKKFTGLTAVVALVCIVLLILGIAGWEFMLAVGVIHAHLLPAVQAAGFPDCLLVLVLLSGAFGTLTGAWTNDK